MSFIIRTGGRKGKHNLYKEDKEDGNELGTSEGEYSGEFEGDD